MKECKGGDQEFTIFTISEVELFSIITRAEGRLWPAALQTYRCRSWTPSCLGQTGAQTLSRVVAGGSGGGFVSDDSSQGQGRRRRLEL